VRIHSLFVATALSLLTAPPLGANPAPSTVDSTLFGASEPDDDVLKIDLAEDGHLLRIAGDLEAGSYRKVKRILDAAKDVKTVWLDSGGGLVLEGFLIGSIVRQMKLDTYVESHCASACTMILTSGVNRAAYRRAKIGFHNSVEVDKNGNPVPFKPPKGSKSTADEPDFMQMAAFRQAGVDSDFIDKALATPNTSIWEPSHDELIKAHVLTRSVDDPARQAIKGFGQSWPDLRASLLTNAAWALVEKDDATLFDETVTDAWSYAKDDEDGGVSGYAERALSEQIFGAIADGPDALVTEFLALDAQTPAPPKDSDKADNCGAMSTGAAAIRRMVADGAKASELDLIKAALSHEDDVDLPDDRAGHRLFNRLYKSVGKAAKTEGNVHQSGGIQACTWNRLTFDRIRALPHDQQVPMVRALHAIEME